MWEAKSSIQKRLSLQKHNRNLRRRLTLLNREIEDYTSKLTRQNWENTCNYMELQIGSAKTWNLLRYLLDPESSKTIQRHNLSKIIRTYPGTEKDLLQEIQDIYVGDTTPNEQLHPYAGEDNQYVDRPITVAKYERC